ncbi:C2-DOMAIN ABA-RELATED 10-like protein [Drosera capensis]
MAHERSVGLLRIRVLHGIDLAIRDICSSDPYVVITMGNNQKVKTRIIKRNINPEWNDELTLSITNPHLPIKLTVFDFDRFSGDDEMGDADIDIKPYLECLSMGIEDLPIGMAVRKVQPDGKNCLADESKGGLGRERKDGPGYGVEVEECREGIGSDSDRVDRYSSILEGQGFAVLEMINNMGSTT